MIVAFVTATVGRNVVPLDQDQVALEAGWEAVLVGGVVVLGGDVGAGGVVGVWLCQFGRDTSRQRDLGDVLHGIGVEAGLGGDLAVLDRTGVELVVS